MPCRAAWRWRRILRRWLAVAGATLLCPPLALLCPPALAALPDDLGLLSLEELLEVEVRLVSRGGETVQLSPAAVYVLSNDDIRRSPATTIPELLRTVPGVEVARIATGIWAIAIRGFNGRFSDKLLVQIDGRNLYTPSGFVYWDLADYLLEDVERIEVVRGPGAALWGANAVNGIINIVTRNAADSRGGLLVAGAGDEERGFGGLRYGGDIDGVGALRGYIKHFDRDPGRNDNAGVSFDAWRGTRAGLRFDRGDSRGERFTLLLDGFDSTREEEAFRGVLGPPFVRVNRVTGTSAGASVLARGHWRSGERSRYQLQAYVDHLERDDNAGRVKIDTSDLGFQHQWQWAARNTLIWGANYRYISDDAGVGRERWTGNFIPPQRHYDYASVFFQQDWWLLDERLRLVAGSKLEHNDFSGLESQPSLRGIWTADRDTSVWAAVSRAVRTPSRTGQDGIGDALVQPGPGGVPVFLEFRGSRDFDSEKLLAYELGWRDRLGPVQLDLALFYSDYSELRTIEPQAPQPQFSPVFHLLVPLVLHNRAEGAAWGGELLLKLQPTRRWRLELAYAHLQLDIKPDRDSGDPIAERPEGESPTHRASLRSLWQLSRSFSASAQLRYAGEVPAHAIDSYWQLDLLLSKQLAPALELSLAGTNLLDSRQMEFVSTISSVPRTEIQRSIYAALCWRF